VKRLALSVGLLVIVLLLRLDISLDSLAQSDNPCQVIVGTDDATGAKKIVTICDGDIGGVATETPGSTSSPTATRTPVTPGATVTPAPPGAPTGGLWLSKEGVQALPQTGAWSAVQSAAAGNCNPDLANQDSSCNATILANALAWARTDDESYRQKVVAAIRSIVQNQSESGGRTLALARELAAYIAAADLIDLRNFDPALHNAFKLRLNELRSKTLSGMTLIGTHKRRPNNWGTMACTSRAAAAVYLGDQSDLADTAFVMRGWLGEADGYKGFTWGDLSWQGDKGNPAGINRVGATIQGHDVSGFLPEEFRRAGGFRWPPGTTGYAWGGMSGITNCAEILLRAGYPVYEWGQNALCRASDALHGLGWQATGDDAGTVAILNLRCGTSHPVNGNAPGKQMGWQQWTHQRAVAAQDVIVVNDFERIVTGDSLTDLQKELDYVLGLEPEWIVVGEPYTTTLDGDVVFAQKLESE
jgi:hypothetical protein